VFGCCGVATAIRVLASGALQPLPVAACLMQLQNRVHRAAVQRVCVMFLLLLCAHLLAPRFFLDLRVRVVLVGIPKDVSQEVKD
jgi:hypothetical protein